MRRRPVTLRDLNTRAATGGSGGAGDRNGMAIVYRKTAKGLTEIETRAHKLPPRLRSALILVDGKRSSDDLARLILQDPDGTLQALADGGFIEAAAVLISAPPRPPAAGPSPAPVPPAPPAPPAPAPADDFPALRRDAVRRLTDLVGPVGEALAMRIEKTRSPDELRPLLTVAMQVIGNTRGRQAAADYGKRFGIDAG